MRKWTVLAVILLVFCLPCIVGGIFKYQYKHIIANYHAPLMQVDIIPVSTQMV